MDNRENISCAKKLLDSKLYKEYISKKIYPEGVYVVLICGSSGLGFTENKSDIDLCFISKDKKKIKKNCNIAVYEKETGKKMDFFKISYNIAFNRFAGYNKDALFYNYNTFLHSYAYLTPGSIIYDETNGKFYQFIENNRRKIHAAYLISSYYAVIKDLFNQFFESYNNPEVNLTEEILAKYPSNFLKAAVDYFKIKKPDGTDYSKIINDMHYYRLDFEDEETIPTIMGLIIQVRDKVEKLVARNKPTEELLEELNKKYLFEVFNEK